MKYIFLILFILIYNKSMYRLSFIARCYLNLLLMRHSFASVDFILFIKHYLYHIINPIIIHITIISLLSFFSLTLSLSRHTTSNFTERFNDTLIWYSFNRAPSNFTSSPGETLCTIVVASSPVFVRLRSRSWFRGGIFAI